MPSIAALGPSNTFSELAARFYASRIGADCSVKLFPTLGRAFAASGSECDHGVLPIENMTDGFVTVVLDSLVNGDLRITDELLVPVQFSFVGNASATGEITRVFAQFVTQGQCERFLDGLGNIELITTQSNGVSLEQALKGIPGEGAVVPAHTVRTGDFPLIVENIADYPTNRTRFIVLSRADRARTPGAPYKTSLLIFESVDRPGVLSSILNAFASRGINLMSIISRPTKEELGRYHFFIDIEGHHEDAKVREAFAEIGALNTVKMLGSYPRATEPIDLRQAQNIVRAPSDDDALLPARLGASPFAVPGERPEVFVASGADAYRTTREALGRIDLSPARGKRVLLKPNAGRAAAPESGITTHPLVVAAAIDAFREAGATVAIGESPVAGVDTMRAFEITGIAAAAWERGCPLIDMDKRRYVRRDVPGGVAIQSLKLCREVLEHDIVVSMPVMKTHMHTGVTLSVKNMKGCLWRRSKVDLHMLPDIPGNPERSLNVAIADMAAILQPHLSIIDGMVGMEGLGPSAGSAKRLGVVVVSAHPFAADAVACALMGIDASAVPHLRMAAERGTGVIDLDRVVVHPPDWRSHAQSFAGPPENLSIEFPGVNIYDLQSCSACQSTLMLFLQRYGKDLGLGAGADDLNVVIGKGHQTVPRGSLCVGNCAARYKAMGIHVVGCPPVASEIFRAFEQRRDASSPE